jgi:hypothetical protein
MTKGVRTYNPKNVQLIVGAIPMSGFADGSFIKVAAAEDAYTMTVGGDGEVSRAASANRSGHCDLTLKQTSASNDILTGFAIADEASDAGVFPVTLLEMGSGRTLVQANGWIEKWPDIDYGKTIENRVWRLALADITRFIGGNASSTGAQ